MVGSVVQVLIISAMMSLLLWRSVQVWRNTPSSLDQYSASLRRVVPAFTIGFCAMLGTALLVIALSNEDGPLVDLVHSVTLVVWVASVWLMVNVYRNGRPESLVPPHLREHQTRRQSIAPEGAFSNTLRPPRRHLQYGLEILRWRQPTTDSSLVTRTSAPRGAAQAWGWSTERLKEPARYWTPDDSSFPCREHSKRPDPASAAMREGRHARWRVYCRREQGRGVASWPGAGCVGSAG